MIRINSKLKEAKLFCDNRSQAVRIRVEFEHRGERVIIHREGNRLITEPVRRKNVLDVLTTLKLPAAGDAFAEDIDTGCRRSAAEGHRPVKLARDMLETNILSYFARNPNGPIAGKIAQIGDNAISASVITVEELRYGCMKTGSAKLTGQVEAIQQDVDIVPFDMLANAAYGAMRTGLEPPASSSVRMIY